MDYEMRRRAEAWPVALRRGDPQAVDAMHRLLIDMGRVSSDLTLTEVAVLQALADNGSNARAAKVLGISVETVKSHLKKIHVKMDTDSTLESVAWAMRLGIIE